MTTLHQLIGSENNKWRCPNCKGEGVEIHEERPNALKARELMHYQNQMSRYRKMCDRYRVRIAELETLLKGIAPFSAWIDEDEETK